MDRPFALERIDDIRDLVANLYDANEDAKERLLVQADEIDYLRNVIPDPTLAEEIDRDLQGIGDELTRMEDELRLLRTDLSQLRISLKTSTAMLAAINQDLQEIRQPETLENVQIGAFPLFDQEEDHDSAFENEAYEAYGS